MLAQPAGSLSSDADWPKRLILWASVAAISFLCFWYVFNIVLLAFAGALLAIILHACAEWVEKHSPKRIGPRLSYTVTILRIAIWACLIAFWVVPRAISEAQQVIQIIPKSLAQLTIEIVPAF